ncbi:hypothetical protein O1611_g731 [Lasiodiplodia mahajangana]|uniref:Uncharacterized protein n=1 Tax=Lasiodiplodia mahajangana TaxID=1108764 RepID=A0ACC2K010_9PEZI|nr:hypothetical protein O1611_g731 [Lasiodiplodia mahajangana]
MLTDGVLTFLQLITAGAIILGKANLSEWAWYRSDNADSGWSANPGGSSSGPAVAVAAGFSPLSIGTEAMGSLIMPSDRAALYTIKPTLKIVPQEGIIPITLEADSAGPMTKSVRDLANLLDVLVDPAKTTVPEGGYQSAVTGTWGDIKIGVVEPDKWLWPEHIVKPEKEASDQMLREWKSAYEHLRTIVKVVKPVSLLSLNEATEDGTRNVWNAFDSTFKGLLESYLGSVDCCKIKTLEDLIKFNEDHADQELPRSADNQAGLIRALHADMREDEYLQLISFARDRCGTRGIDQVLEDNGVDILMGPGDGPMMSIAGMAGYPSATLPLGYLDFNGRPFGLQISAKAHQEDLLIQAQSAWEATFPQRQPPSLDKIVKTGEISVTPPRAVKITAGR